MKDHQYFRHHLPVLPDAMLKKNQPHGSKRSLISPVHQLVLANPAVEQIFMVIYKTK